MEPSFVPAILTVPWTLGRLPAVVDSYTNVVDVEDVARGHVLAARKGKAGQRYILGGDNLRWSEVMDRVAKPVTIGRSLAEFERVVAPQVVAAG